MIWFIIYYFLNFDFLNYIYLFVKLLLSVLLMIFIEWIFIIYNIWIIYSEITINSLIDEKSYCFRIIQLISFELYLLTFDYLF
jgi:hypothetical protein